MRPVYVCAFVFAALALPMAADEMDVTPSDVTVVLNIKGSSSPQAIQEMQRESSQIIAASGLRLDWKMRGDAVNHTFKDLVVLTFNGSCAYVPAPPIYD